MSKLSRRSLVAGAALPAAGSAVAVASEGDPIFAIIEAYRRGWAHWGALLHAKSVFEETHRGADGSLPFASDHPELETLEEQSDKAGDEQMKLARQLCNTLPTTLAGLAAVLKFVIDDQENRDGNLLRYKASDDPKVHGDLTSPLFRTLVKSIEQMALARVS